jgi:hypothetical protein
LAESRQAVGARARASKHQAASKKSWNRAASVKVTALGQKSGHMLISPDMSNGSVDFKVGGKEWELLLLVFVVAVEQF